MKKFTLLLLAMLTFCFVQNVVAQVPYCTYDDATRTLTIGCAAKLPEGAFDISTPQKDGISLQDSITCYNVFIYAAKTIVIDKSFLKFKPTTCEGWFSCFDEVTTITGLENINTKNVTSMQDMFLRCEKLTSLDLRVLIQERLRIWTECLAIVKIWKLFL